MKTSRALLMLPMLRALPFRGLPCEACSGRSTRTLSAMVHKGGLTIYRRPPVIASRKSKPTTGALSSKRCSILIIKVRVHSRTFCIAHERSSRLPFDAPTSRNAHAVTVVATSVRPPLSCRALPLGASRGSISPEPCCVRRSPRP